MKKIAFFVEGETEYIFISWLLKKIASSKGIDVSIVANKLEGGGRKKPIRVATLRLESTIIPHAKYEALIQVAGTDHRISPSLEDTNIDTDIENFHKSLQSTNSENEYSLIIGLRDLKGEKPDSTPFTLADLPKMELLSKVTIRNCVLKDIIPTSIIIAVYEIEAWFLAECTHFQRVDSILTNTFVTSNMGFNPCIDDMTLRPEPAVDLHNAYQLGRPPKSYSKKKSHIERTINSLDYAYLYDKIRHDIAKVNELVTKIDTFLT